MENAIKSRGGMFSLLRRRVRLFTSNGNICVVTGSLLFPHQYLEDLYGHYR